MIKWNGVNSSTQKDYRNEIRNSGSPTAPWGLKAVSEQERDYGAGVQPRRLDVHNPVDNPSLTFLRVTLMKLMSPK